MRELRAVCTIRVFLTVPIVPSPEKQLAGGHSLGTFFPNTVPTPAGELASAGQQGNRWFFSDLKT